MNYTIPSHPPITRCSKLFPCVVTNIVVRNSSVGTATRYGAGWSGDRIQVEVRFSTPFHCARSTQPASCKMGNGSVSWG